MIKSSHLINSVNDLNELKLEDKKIYDTFLNNTTCPATSWWSQFVYFWGHSFRPQRKSYWAIIDDLFVPFIYNKGNYSLLIVPIGNASPDVYCEVILKCFNFCEKHNGTSQEFTRILWMNEDQKNFLEGSNKYRNFFKPKKASVGPEFYYDIDLLCSLEGKEFSYIRRKINKLERNFPQVVFKEYDILEYDEMISFYNKWFIEASTRYNSVFDRSFFPEIVKDKKQLKHTIIAAYDNNKIIGVTSGQVDALGRGYCFFRKSLQMYDGLSELLVKKLALHFKTLDPDLKVFNDGGGGKTQGLHFFKDRFRPVAKIDRYRLRLREIEIVSTRFFPNTSFISNYSSARFVVSSFKYDLYNDAVPEKKLNEINKLIDLILEKDLNGYVWEIEKTPAMILAQFGILVQRASNFEVHYYDVSQLSETNYEIHFECIRKDIVSVLKNGLKFILKFIFEKSDGEDLIQWYKENRDILGSTLQEYVLHDRLETAKRMGIDASIDQSTRILIGQGHKSKTISLGYTQNTPRLGKTISGNKAISNKYLSDSGLPVPKQYKFSNKSSVLKSDINFPAVLKPRNGHKGKDVITNINTVENLLKAYRDNSFQFSKMVVEEHIEGEDYRLLVVNGKFVAAVTRVPAHVIADGIHSVNELIEITNKDQRRDGLYLLPIIADDDLKRVIEKQNITLETVLEKNKIIKLREAANVSLGGSTIDVTHHVHPDNKSAAVTAAKCCLLDVAGVDFVTTDISKSWRDGFGKIIEVNSGPGADLHMLPTEGSKQDISSQFIRTHFGVNEDTSIPTIAIVGKYNKQSILNECKFIWEQLGNVTGTYSKGIFTLEDDEILLNDNFNDDIKTFIHQKNLDKAAMVWSLIDLVFKGIPLEKFTCMIFTDFLNDQNINSRIFDENISSRIYKKLADLSTNGVIIDGDNLELMKHIDHLPFNHIVKVFFNKIDFITPNMKTHIENGGRLLTIDKLNNLTWYENGNSYNIDNVIVSKKIKQKMYAIAAILTSGTNVNNFKNSLFKIDAQMDKKSTLLRFSNDKTNIALADPRDLEALKILKILNNEKKYFIWIIVSEESSAIDQFDMWLEKFNDKSICVVFVGTTKKQFDNSISFPTIETAYETVIHKAHEDELVLILDMNTEQRMECLKKIKNTLFENRDTSLDLENIDKYFNGRWIGNVPYKKNIDNICWGEGEIKENTLTVLPGIYNDLELIQSTKNSLESSLNDGANAVITPVYSDTIPKWSPVFLCDDPLNGMLKLSDVKRSKIKGKVVSLLSSNKFYYSLLETDNDKIYVSQLDEQYDQIIMNSINLINTPENLKYTIFLYPQMSLDLLSFRVLEPNILIYDTFDVQLNTDTLERFIANISSLIILTSKENKKYWNNHFHNNKKVKIVVVDNNEDKTKITLDVKNYHYNHD